MLTIVQRGGATQEKPPEVVRGYSSRLPWAWDSLAFAVPFNDFTRDAARDLVYNVAPQAVVGTLQWTKDNRGNPAALLDASSCLDYPDTPTHNKASTAFTAYVRLRRAGTGDTSGGIFCKVWDQTFVAPEVSWYIQHSDAGDNVAEGVLGLTGNTNANAFGYDPTYVIGTTDWISIFARWRSGEAPILDILGERGQHLGGVAGTVMSGTIPYVTGQPIRINGGPQNTLNYNAAYSQCMLWSRRLTDTECQALVSDPYGWYSPRRSTVVTSSSYPLIPGGGEVRHGTTFGGLR